MTELMAATCVRTPSELQTYGPPSCGTPTRVSARDNRGQKEEIRGYQPGETLRSGVAATAPMVSERHHGAISRRNMSKRPEVPPHFFFFSAQRLAVFLIDELGAFLRHGRTSGDAG